MGRLVHSRRGDDRRFGWSAVPVVLVAAGNALTVLGFAIILRVFRENPYARSTIEVEDEQTVISTGPYAVVRHPMYAGGALYLLAMPLALGSYWGLLAFAAMLPLLVWRLFDEEAMLSRKLPGYAEYSKKVRWRMIPKVF
jgi:protein-S-isoprenylcysteine O-methyltransferase Ste14